MSVDSFVQSMYMSQWWLAQLSAFNLRPFRLSVQETARDIVAHDRIINCYYIPHKTLDE